MGEIVYFLRGDKSKAYLNITPNYECTNDCVFCDKHLLEERVHANLYLEKEPSLEEVIAEIKAKVNKILINEFVFCGIGEPLIYLDKVLDITKYIKSEYKKPVRINTNGQAYVLYPKRNVVKLLEQAGVDSVSISLNTTNDKAYKMLHRPKHGQVFPELISFIKDCSSSNINTTATFLEFPKLNKKEVFEFTRSLGLRDEQVRFRQFLRR